VVPLVAADALDSLKKDAGKSVKTSKLTERRRVKKGVKWNRGSEDRIQEGKGFAARRTGPRFICKALVQTYTREMRDCGN
jgi:hypothetical protein